MNDLRELYQEVILDHGKNPRNLGRLPDASHHADGHNPLCGDRIQLSLKVVDGVVIDARFEGSGCAISMASTSMMTELVIGKTVEEARKLFKRFHTLVTTPMDEEVDLTDVGKLAVFSGVREFPVRIKCATLPWHTMDTALDGEADNADDGAPKPVSTE